MTPSDAARILEVPADATPEQLERRFHELRAKLEDRIAKAPTPGLKEKYRASLVEITEAFETLVLLADSALLPVLQNTAPAASAQDGLVTVQPASPAVTVPPPPPAPRNITPAKSHDREFKLVALLAVAIFVIGGWWIFSTREENARKAAEVAHQKQVEEEAKQQAAAAEKAEAARKETAIARLRTEFAEARLTWDSFDKEQRAAERALSEYKSEARNSRELPPAKINEYVARVQVTQRYLNWLEAKLDRHPATIARAKVEELLSARMPEEAEVQLREMRSALAELGSEIAEQKQLLDQLEGSVEVTSTPSGLGFDLLDGFGRTHRGTTPAKLNGIAPGAAKITLHRSGFADEDSTVNIEAGAVSRAKLAITSETVVVTAESDVEFWSNNKFISRGQYTFTDYRPDKYSLELRRPNTQSMPLTIEVKQGKGTRTLNFSLTAAAAQNIPCPDCEHRGYIDEEKDCTHCNGGGYFRCGVCSGRGWTVVINGVRFPCVECGSRGKIRCNSCNGKGSIAYRNRCQKCGGDGYLSQIDAAR